VTAELHAKRAWFCELNLPTFADSTKQVLLHFIRDFDQYFNLRPTPDELRLPLTFRAIQEPSQRSGFPVPLINLKAAICLRKHLLNYFGIQVIRPVLGVRFI